LEFFKKFYCYPKSDIGLTTGVVGAGDAGDASPGKSFGAKLIRFGKI